MKSIIALTAAAAAVLAAPAAAENFTYEIRFGEPSFVGGMGEEGRDGRSGTMSGPFTSTSASGASVSGNVTCIGMDQPDNSLFDVHFSCTATRSDGTNTSLIYGCNWLGEDMGLSCVGGAEGRDGTTEGRRGVLTMHLKEGVSTGTGQWIE
ncbi:hypothetical protein [Qipengyuania aquimaris]|uniref:hypothetical protein n=1 Tax=Qipengyuania aquimaris TaxID=255984 RepID=UPI001FD19263|nr:hypothetical protein [Qipengyuania aquimaris]UOR15310.1 hypothetical protein LCM05_12640 [Qipengyuania aquimaris]